MKIKVKESNQLNAVLQLFVDMCDDYPCGLIMDDSNSEVRGVELRDQYGTKVVYVGRRLTFIFDRDEIEDDGSLLDHAEALTKHVPMRIACEGDTVHFDADGVTPEQAAEIVKDYFEVD